MDTIPVLEHLTGHVLVVDDESQNRELLCDLLEGKDHKVSLACDGTEALKMCKDNSFDVILLDVMMPNMDGFEVTRKLKENPETAVIPVLLITALHSRQDRLKGIQAGANDFITKPIDVQDVILRTRNSIFVRKLYDQLHHKHRQILEVESLREDLSNMIVHDMRTALSVIKMSVDLMSMQDMTKNKAGLAQTVSRIDSSCRNLIDMANLILDTQRLEEGKMPLNKNTHNIGDIINDVIEMLGPIAENIACLTSDVKGNGTLIGVCDADLIRRVIMNLSVNAIKVVSKGTGNVAITAAVNGDRLKVSVEDNGPGILPEYHEKIFSKFGQVEAKRKSQFHTSGLGLTFCKLAIEAHEGKIGVESEPGKGSKFWFTLGLK